MKYLVIILIFIACQSPRKEELQFKSLFLSEFYMRPDNPRITYYLEIRANGDFASFCNRRQYCDSTERAGFLNDYLIDSVNYFIQKVLSGDSIQYSKAEAYNGPTYLLEVITVDNIQKTVSFIHEPDLLNRLSDFLARLAETFPDKPNNLNVTAQSLRIHKLFKHKVPILVEPNVILKRGK